MEEFKLLSDEELDQKPLFNSLEEALANADECYQLELVEGKESEADLEAAFPQLKRLQSFILIGNSKVREFPASFALLKNLQYIEVRECTIEYFPEGMADFSNMAAFVLSDCPKLRMFPKFIYEWRDLEYLELSGTGIMAIPEGIGKLKNLEDLNINQNKLHDLPKDFGKLRSLETLRTYGNFAMFVSAPDFKKLRSLETFDHGLIQFEEGIMQDVQAALPKAVFTQVTRNDEIYRG